MEKKDRGEYPKISFIKPFLSLLFAVLLQMPTPKVGLFGTPLKIDPKIRKISKIQINTEIALVNEIHRNLRQMEALGLYFQVFFEILNFR